MFMNFRNYLSTLLLGILALGASAQINLNPSSSYKYLKGIDAANLPDNWMTSDYNSSGWATGNMPFRYDIGSGGTLLDDMQNNYSTLYLVSTFNAQNIASLKDVFFRVNFDDGFALWINGESVFSVNAPVHKTYNSVATDQGEYQISKTYRLPAHDIELREGENLIAIQAFNSARESSDFYINFAIQAEVPEPQTSDTLKAVFSRPNGFYNSPFDLRLDVPDPSYTLIYTIDGSNPQISPTAVSAGTSATLTIDPAQGSGRPLTPAYIVRASLKKGNLAPSFPLTQSYIFLDRVMNQSYPGGEWPSGPVNEQVIDLEMDPDITLSGEYGASMNRAMTDIPSISVVTELSDLFDPATGIYVNALEHGEGYERFCSVELIDPSGKPGFNINAGLRIRGGYSRNSHFPKHAFRLFFRQEYGAPKLNFPLFGDEGVSEFDKIDLRCEQNYAWSHPEDDRERHTGVRDVFSRDTQRDMGRPYTRSRYYHLYLNGMYWGLFQTQERSEARYAADYLGGSKEDYDVIKVDAQRGMVEATDGTLDKWMKIYQMTEEGYESNEDYFALEGKDQYGKPTKGGEVLIDIDNLIDYMQLIFYTGNFDSPVSAFMKNEGPNNFYTLDRRDDRSSGFIFFSYDAEHTLMIEREGPGIGIQENRVQPTGLAMLNSTKFQPQWIHHKLSFNAEYRQRFADRAYLNFFNKGVFTPSAVRERFEKRAKEIELAIIAESARWGDAHREPPYTKANWSNEINDLYNRYFPYRTDIVIDQLKAANLLASFNPPVYTKDNSTLDQEVYSVSGDYQVALSSPVGQIFYTLDGTDPRLLGGEINVSAKEIPSGGTISLQGTAFIQSRVKNGNLWSALASVKLVDPNENYANLKVTELHFHPTDSVAGTEIVPGTSFEFIELKNTGDKPISLAGLKFTSAIEYQFKETDILAPQQFWVIASKPKWFYERHFRIPSGNFAKNFANSGEQVIISNSAGSPIINFQYFDINPWPTQPDGEGPSLSTVFRNPTGNPNDAAYWKASTVYDGTPFADDRGVVDSNDSLAEAKHPLVIYPNPTHGQLFIKMNDPLAQFDMEINTLSGSRVYRSPMTGNTMLDLGRLNIGPGVYLIRIKGNEQNTVHKVVYRP